MSASTMRAADNECRAVVSGDGDRSIGGSDEPKLPPPQRAQPEHADAPAHITSAISTATPRSSARGGGGGGGTGNVGEISSGSAESGGSGGSGGSGAQTGRGPGTSWWR